MPEFRDSIPLGLHYSLSARSLAKLLGPKALTITDAEQLLLRLRIMYPPLEGYWKRPVPARSGSRTVNLER